MKRLTLFIVCCFAIVGLSACGAAPTPTSLVPVMLSPSVELTEPPIALSTETALPTETLPPTNTPPPTATFGPTPTETPLPTLELPTLAAVEPAFDVWDGAPTFIADSMPGFYFRVKYDPRTWALAPDSFGQPSLTHREIAYCIIAPGGVRGMTPGVQVEHDTRKIGNLYYEVNTVLQNGLRQFITYQATDKVIFTSFQLNFTDRIDDCIADAEVVLGTLISIPQDQATPVP
jgi:hypothetical protein